MFDKARTEFFGTTHTRQEERYAGPEAAKYWYPKWQEWLSTDEAEYRHIRELARS